MMRFAGLATAFALTACALPATGENAQAEQRRERAQRHGRLALAYVSHQRFDIARQEAAMALSLVPDDPQALHAAALAELGAGRLPMALPYLAAAARVMTTQGDDVQRDAILSNYAAALCAAGRAADARYWRQRAREADGARGEAMNAGREECGTDEKG